MTSQRISAVEDRIASLKQELDEANQELENAKQQEQQEQNEREERNAPHGTLFRNQHGEVFVLDMHTEFHEGRPRMWRLGRGPGDQHWPMHTTRERWEGSSYNFQFTAIRNYNGSLFTVSREE